mmetsp:Transcript_52997/g.77662  ORF Transcript_52997/g.77662 Transcript_52997/m.77662 type:complete len:231 (-) Transcript_52997:64-756(-)
MSPTGDSTTGLASSSTAGIASTSTPVHSSTFTPWPATSSSSTLASLMPTSTSTTAAPSSSTTGVAATSTPVPSSTSTSSSTSSLSMVGTSTAGTTNVTRTTTPAPNASGSSTYASSVAVISSTALVTSSRGAVATGTSIVKPVKYSRVMVVTHSCAKTTSKNTLIHVKRDLQKRQYSNQTTPRPPIEPSTPPALHFRHCCTTSVPVMESARHMLPLACFGSTSLILSHAK